MRFSRKHSPLRHRIVQIPLLIMMLVSLTGCLTFETFITVKPDGSGTVVQTFILTNDMLRMALMFGGDDGQPIELCDEDELAEEAVTMGEGVRLISAEEINDGDAIGCRAQFAFDDINTLLINFNPENQMPAGMVEGEEEGETPDDAVPEDETAVEDLVTFKFERGDPATLLVRLEQNDERVTPTEDPAPVDSTMREQQMMMMREMFKGARIAVLLAVEGTIAETNASFQDGNRITLMDIDFDKMLADEANLEKIFDANPQSADEMKALMEVSEGVMVETSEEVKIVIEE